ncbi:metal-dependent hydrolase [Candidatus Woesearchaeota archaeon]|nr:metal-dependent hydrolase [Candidatus Woesearchaeota archaeon]
MAFPAAHIIFPMLIAETYRRYFTKLKFSFIYVFLAGAAGAFPDVDIFVSMLVSQLTGNYVNYHRSITHALVLPVFILLLCVFCAAWSKRMKEIAWKRRFHGAAFLLLISGFGILAHLSLDCLAGNNALLLPFKRVQVCSGILLDANNAGIFDGILVLSWFFLYGGVLAEIRQWRERSAQKRTMQPPTRSLSSIQNNIQKRKTSRLPRKAAKANS